MSNSAQKFTDLQTEYSTYINELMQSFKIELVLYDEVEYFKKHDDPQFNYPYERRKNKLNSYTLNLDMNEETSNYEYFLEEVRLQNSIACLEPNVFE